MKSPLVKKYGASPRWVSWKLETVKGKQTKVPYNAITGMKASSTDPATWTIASKVIGDNLGIVLHDKLLFCIDIDHVLTDGSIRSLEHGENIFELVVNSDTYTEVSQSGTGLHLFFALTEPLELTANKKAPYEVYTNGRYICTTGKSFGEEKEVRTITPTEALEIIEKIVPQKVKESVLKDTVSTEKSISYFENDTELLNTMFASKNGKKIKDLFDGITDISDASSADSALCCHLAYWTGKDPVQMDRLLLLSVLGKREKMKRKDYRERTIKAAIAFTKDTYKPPETKSLDLLYTMGGKDKDIKVFTLNTENIVRVLEQHSEFKGTVRYDKFSNELEILKSNKWRKYEEGDDIAIQAKISVLFPCFGKVSKQMVFDAMVHVSRINAVDSAVDYLTSIEWDKKERLDFWLTETYGVEANDYHKKVASNWMKGLVKRLVYPGSKFDYVLVLEGEQGAKKSSSLSILGGDWHVETAMSTDSKDFFMQFQGKSIIEFSEGETLSRTEVKRMKAIITMQKDRFRLPYGRTTQDFPRRCVFAMTTNESEYLKDETGNRRWLPVATVFPEANIEWLIENRDQLFAEAYHRTITLNETTYEFPKEETRKAQDSRMVSDPNVDLIAEWYHNILTDIDRTNGITTHRVFSECLHKNWGGTPMKKWEEMMISNILKKHLGLRVERKTVNNVKANRWFSSTLPIPTSLEIQSTEKIF